MSTFSGRRGGVVALGACCGALVALRAGLGLGAEDLRAGVLAELDFVGKSAALPSASGWTYSAANHDVGLGEHDVFSLSSGALSVDTMGQAHAEGRSGSNQYTFDTSGFGIDSGTIELVAEARVTAGELSGYAYGFALTFGVGSRGFMQIGLMPDSIASSPDDVREFDATVWREYRLVGDVDARTFDVYVDGKLFASDAPFRAGGFEVVAFGDASGSANASTEVRSVRVEASAVVVPTPASACLLAVGGLAATRRRR